MAMAEGTVIRGATRIGLADMASASWHARKRTMLTIIGGAVALLVAIAIVSGDHRDTLLNLGMAAVLVPVWIGSFWLGNYLCYRKLKPDQLQITYELTDEALTVTDGTGAAIRTPWTNFAGVKERADAFFLAAKPAGLRLLPKRAFAPDAVDDLRACLARHVSTLQ